MSKFISVNINKFYAYTFFFLLILPFALVTGPFLSDLFAIIIGLFAIFIIISKAQYHLIFNKYFYFFIFFCLISIVFSIFSENIMLSLSSSLFYFRFIFFAIGIAILLNYSEHFIKLFFYSIFIISILLFVDVTFEYINGYNILNHSSNLHNRVGSFFSMDIFGSENVVGQYIIRVLPWGLILMLDEKIKFKNHLINNLILLFFIISPLYLCLISGDRTPFFLSIIFFLTTIIFFPINKSYKILISITSFTLLFLILIFSEKTYERVVKSSLESFNFSNEKIFIFSYDHDSHYRAAYKMIKKNFPSGIGPKLFREECKKDIYIINEKSCTSHPHNYFIQLVLEIGVFGLFFVLFVYSFLVFKFFKNYFLFKKNMTNSKEFMYYIPLIIILFPFVPSHQFYSNWWSVMIYLSFGLLFYKLGLFKIVNKPINN